MLDKDQKIQDSMPIKDNMVLGIAGIQIDGKMLINGLLLMQCNHLLHLGPHRGLILNGTNLSGNQTNHNGNQINYRGKKINPNFNLGRIKVQNGLGDNPPLLLLDQILQKNK